ncbi:hypothetical protein KIPB_003194 [Kipferlia bialata]|uniref:Uncharacterized protein n=1 Tax=Kipferlia bialata TaxID=797122 RepID=A0A9K3CS32_9EUKA|nr:hypothetical protein KIPB_003194 [Kipferlia bialata]|eukprot:g3194.t1
MYHSRSFDTIDLFIPECLCPTSSPQGVPQESLAEVLAAKTPKRQLRDSERVRLASGGRVVNGIWRKDAAPQAVYRKGYIERHGETTGGAKECTVVSNPHGPLTFARYPHKTRPAPALPRRLSHPTHKKSGRRKGEKRPTRNQKPPQGLKGHLPRRPLSHSTRQRASSSDVCYFPPRRPCVHHQVLSAAGSSDHPTTQLYHVERGERDVAQAEQERRLLLLGSDLC